MKGDVVVVSFPFTDLTGFSRRPAIVLANLIGDDIILCQITSQKSRFDKYPIILEEVDFKLGRLPNSSLIRVNKIFTASKKVILKKVGTVNSLKFLEMENKLIKIIKN